VASGKIREAAVMYREAGNLEKTLQLAEACGLLDLAAPLLRERGDMTCLISLYEKYGHHSHAAQVYEEIHNWKGAAAQWEQASHYLEAAQDYLKAGLSSDAAKMAGNIENIAARVEILIRADHFGPAAEVMEHHNQLDQALDLYIQANRLEDALRIAERLEKWEIVSSLAVRCGALEKAAYARRRLGNLTKAAELYEQLAIEAETRLAPQQVSNRVAELYERALECLNERQEPPQRIHRLKKQIERNRQIPHIVLTIHESNQIFILNQLGILSVTLENIGWGQARNLEVYPSATFDSNLVAEVPPLEPGEIWAHSIRVRPIDPTQLGLNIEMKYWVRGQDVEGKNYNLSESVYLPVARELIEARHIKELLKNNTEKVYQIVDPGNVYLGNVDQRHDYVELRRGVVIDQSEVSKKTPSFCNYCGFPLVNYPDRSHCPRCESIIDRAP
jgi:hypothetical protein